MGEHPGSLTWGSYVTAHAQAGRSGMCGTTGTGSTRDMRPASCGTGAVRSGLCWIRSPLRAAVVGGFPPAACSELLRLHGFPCGGPLACCRAPRLVAYRVDEDEQDGEEESEERDGDHERHLNEKDPRKSEGQSLGYTDDALRA